MSVVYPFYFYFFVVAEFCMPVFLVGGLILLGLICGGFRDTRVSGLKF